MGLLVIDFANRKRYRANGAVQKVGPGKRERERCTKIQRDIVSPNCNKRQKDGDHSERQRQLGTQNERQ